MSSPTLPAFPYGAVYFRKSNPPREDWERDYRTAAEDGMNVFRHWFLWSAIEVSPGVYDWDDYDHQLDLAAKYGLKTIIAEMITSAPEWAFRVYADARLETRDGRRVGSTVGASTALGGFPGLCLDHPAYRAAAERFLSALAERYKDHPGLGGYDIWNECHYPTDTCFCPATAEAFRGWLRARYSDLGTLARTWLRPSLTDWRDVHPPRHMGPYADVLDWLEFRLDHGYATMRWRADLLRAIDPVHPVTAHGMAGTIVSAASRGTDDWRAAREASSYGFTWVASRKGDEPWKQFHAVDLVRAAARGKRFWHSEAQGGPLWMQPQVIGRPREDGRITSAQDVRYWNMVSFMGGATGLLYPRWRPLLDGPLWGAFGAYGMDGGRTPRSEMAGRVARWANAPEQADLWRSRPVRGEVGIVYAPEAQIFAYAQQGNTDLYTQALWGAYQGFFDANIQADWVHVDDIAAYDLLYLPYPIMLSEASAAALRDWVAAGGVLVSEGCPAYFGQHGHVGVVQPNYGLDALFGAREAYVEFTPDILGDLEVNVAGQRAWGGILLQAYTPTTGAPAGRYGDGQVAAVDNSYGAGRTRLVGTCVGAGYVAHPAERRNAFFRDVLTLGGRVPHAAVDDARIVARLHDGEGGAYLWVANPQRTALPVRVHLSEPWRGLHPARTLWGAEASATADGTITLTAPGREVSIIALR
ncbi:MAG: beta-galactosidase [Chloroflexi bacterium]|nr:beta-galactosidase [Chloroflexota bacterium]